MQSLVLQSGVRGELPLDLENINLLIQPRVTLSLPLLEKIKLKRDEILEQMNSLVLKNQIKLQLIDSTSRVKILTEITSFNESRLADPKISLFFEKMLKVINEGIEQKSDDTRFLLPIFLNITLPSYFHSRQLNAKREAQVKKAEEKYLGEQNEERQKFIKTQSMECLINFMETLDDISINSIIEKSEV